MESNIFTGSRVGVWTSSHTWSHPSPGNSDVALPLCSHNSLSILQHLVEYLPYNFLSSDQSSPCEPPGGRGGVAAILPARTSCRTEEGMCLRESTAQRTTALRCCGSQAGLRARPPGEVPSCATHLPRPSMPCLQNGADGSNPTQRLTARTKWGHTCEGREEHLTVMTTQGS